MIRKLFFIFLLLFVSVAEENKVYRKIRIVITNDYDGKILMPKLFLVDGKIPKREMFLKLGIHKLFVS